MINKEINNKSSLNNTISNIFIFISWIVLICAIIFRLVLWRETNDLVHTISGVICALGILFNIYLLAK